MPADRQRRRRPTAYEVSFPGETQAVDSSSTTEVAVQGRLYRQPSALAREARYFPDEKPDDMQKDAVFLEDFAFFDSYARMVPLPCEYTDADIFGAGRACFEGDSPTYIRIGPIYGYSIDLGDRDGLMYIDTKRAQYFLRDPSKQYRMLFRKIYLSYRVVQIVLASAIDDPEREYEDFLNEFLETEIVGKTPDEGDVWDCVPRLIHAAESLPRNLRGTKILDFLLHSPRPATLKGIKPSRHQRMRGEIRAETEAEVIDLTLDE